MKLCGSNVLVRRLPPDDSLYAKPETIIIPGSDDIGSAWMKYDSFECEVLAVGPGEVFPNGQREDMDIEPGFIVIIPQGHGDSTTTDEGFIVDISAIEGVVIKNED